MEKKVFLLRRILCQSIRGGSGSQRHKYKNWGEEEEKKGPNSLWSIRKIYAYHCKYIRQKWGNVFFDTGQPHNTKK
jgi:hypothetical protein